jgi:hypothetical protein
MQSAATARVMFAAQKKKRPPNLLVCCDEEEDCCIRNPIPTWYLDNNNKPVAAESLELIRNRHFA